MTKTQNVPIVRWLSNLAALLMALLMFAGAALAQQDASGKRVALLIGNGAYKHVPVLPNPTNDSADLAKALRDVGFEVIQYTDQGQAKMLETLRSFRRKSNGAEIALIYYAGHGIEIDRQNYLIPIDAELQTYADINFEAVPLDTMIFAAEGASRLSMVIVDACRNNPFANTIQRGNSSRSIGRGLSAVEPSKNTLVAYAAKEGTTAADGEGRNSPYAAALISSLQEPGLEVGLMMRQVRDAVLDKTNGAQEPFVYGSLSADQIFLNATRALVPVEPDEPEQLAAASLPPSPGAADVNKRDASAGEIAFWQSISGTTIAAELETYLTAYPNGLFADLARARLARLDPAATGPKDPFRPLVPQQDAVPKETVDPPLAPLPQRDLTRDEVRDLQERLTVLGHSLGRADGLAGRRTQAAIRAFETAANLPVQGLASLAIYTVLQERVSEDQLQKWRAERARAARAAAPKKAAPKKARPAAPKRQKATQPAAQAQPKKVAPKPAQTPAPAAAPKQTAGDRQFCNAHRLCGTRHCRAGGSVGWRKTQDCRFCPAWAERCN